MTYKEITKLINGYDDSSTIGKSNKKLMRTLAQMAYEAGQADGMTKAAEILVKL